MFISNRPLPISGFEDYAAELDVRLQPPEVLAAIKADLIADGYIPADLPPFVQ